MSSGCRETNIVSLARSRRKFTRITEYAGTVAPGVDAVDEPIRHRDAVIDGPCDVEVALHNRTTLWRNVTN